MSDTSTPVANHMAGDKRPASAAGLVSSSNRPVKRRASKACQCCRARKVRCNVVEHGAPCTNCRLDEVECVITESKRRKKLCYDKLDGLTYDEDGVAVENPSKKSRRRDIPNYDARSSSEGSDVFSDRESAGHVPHLIYQTRGIEAIHETRRERRQSMASMTSAPSLTSGPTISNSSAAATKLVRVPTVQLLTREIPKFVKPIPTRIPADDIDYLTKKGAMSLPLESFRAELLNCYFLYVHPYMPLIDEADWNRITSKNWDNFDGSREKDDRISLLLYQSVLFAGSAFVSMDYLRAAGYPTRKSARKAFFSRARLLYDFDWEHDRISLVQSLLLMTYWYETPDDQKDTWHWMGVAISLSHTIGLHRNPGKSNLDPRRQRLWKRIWWSCFMRDRLVALGMRRPTRIKAEDCDVPMLTLSDFDVDPDTDILELFDADSEEGKSRKRKRDLALMCIEKAKLCVIISNVLSAQYSVLNASGSTDTPVDTTKNTMLLQPKKADAEVCEVKLCDDQLSEWQKQLCPEALWRPASGIMEEVDATTVLHRNLLHMVYFTTVSALHRPQVLPSAPAPWPARNRGAELQDISRKKVRHAAQEITRLAEEMIEYDLVRYLPTVGVTVMLPAVIIHLLDIKSSSLVTRELSLQGFGLCMQVMQGLRENYAAADFATHFLEAAVKKADISIPAPTRQRFATADAAMQEINRQRHVFVEQQNKLQEKRVRIQPTPVAIIAQSPSLALTPPPENNNIGLNLDSEDDTVRFRLESFLATTPASNAANSLITPDFGADGDYFVDYQSSATSSNNEFITMDLNEGERSLDSLLKPSHEDPFLGSFDHQFDLGMHGAGESSGLGLDFGLMGQDSKMLDNMEFDFEKIMEGL